MIAAQPRLWRNERGAISVITALVLPAFIGTLGLGIEVSYWLLRNRSLQNAADSAAIAASQAGTGYAAQAKAVTRQYGLVDGAKGVTVTASNTAACPSGGSDCYSVTVADTVPTYVGALVNYLGTASVGGVRSTRISAMAIASPGSTSHEYCLVALASAAGTLGIDSKGSPKADLTGCGVRSNSDMSCAGHNLNATFGDASGTNSGCGATQTSGVAGSFADPYASKISSLAADACGGSYPKVGSLPAGNKWSGAKTLTSMTTICGDLQLTGNVTITAPSDAVLVIRNGQMAMNGYKLQTASGSGLALVFTGANNAAYGHSPTGNGGLDITAPTMGAWSGIALYQDPALTVNVAMPNAASSPTWAFSGLVYLPKVNLNFSGSVGKSSYGAQCTVIIANTVALNGTGIILSTMACGVAGLTTPTNGSTGRGMLAG